MNETSQLNLPKQDSDFDDSWGSSVDVPELPSRGHSSPPCFGACSFGSFEEDDNKSLSSGNSEESGEREHSREQPQASSSASLITGREIAVENKPSKAMTVENDTSIPNPTTNLSRAVSDDFMFKPNRRISAYNYKGAYKGPTPLGLDGNPLRSCLTTASDSAMPDYNSFSEHSFSEHSSSGNNTAADDIAAPPPPTKLKRSVSFNEINVRKYERALGDHPCVSSGAPITIGWRFNEYESIPLDDYEKAKGSTALTKEQIRIPADVRLKMLMDQADVSLKDVKSAELMARKEQESLRKCMKNVGNKKSQIMEELSESMRRKIKRVVSGKSKKQEEHELWKNAHEVAARKVLNHSGRGRRWSSADVDPGKIYGSRDKRLSDF